MAKKLDSVDNLSPAEVVALSKLFDGERKMVKEAREKLTPGDYEVKASVQLEGNLAVGVSVEYTPTSNIPLLVTMALLVQRMGLQKDAALAMIHTAMTEAILLGESGNETIGPMVKDLEGVIAQIRAEVTANLPRQTRNGTAKFAGVAMRRSPDKNFPTITVT